MNERKQSLRKEIVRLPAVYSLTAYCSSQPPQGTYLIRLNLCIICSMVCIALKVLDWYNLYMDFTAYDDKCKYPCSYRKDFEQLKNDK